MKKLLVLAALSVGLTCQAATVSVLDPLTTFGPYTDGSIPPPGNYPPYPPVTVGTSTTGYQRGYAYDPTTGTTVLADPNTGSTGGTNFAGNIYVIDGVTGQVVSTLSTNGISGGTYAGSAVGVGDDGVVYMCNQINNTTLTFVIYSWTNVWQSNSAPSIAYSGNIALNQRYGATMAVRGAGANTQIIIGSKVGTTGTNVVLFTTADGSNFSAIPMATDATKSDFADGIAFGSGNTFWAKSVSGRPLRLMSFNAATSNATTIASFDTNAMPASFNLGPLAVDITNKLLAGIEVVGTSGGGQRVWLYDISGTLTNPAIAPVLLDIKFFLPNHAFASAPNGFLGFGGGNLYTHAINNGLLSFVVDSVTMPPPLITNQPSPSTKRIVTGQSARFEVLAYPAVSSYQWLKNGTNVPNATNAFLNITSATTNDSGTYAVIVSNAAPGTATSSNVVLTVVSPSDLFHLNSLWSVSPSAGAAYFNSTGGASTPNQRTIAYNALSNELYVVSRGGGSSSNFRIYALPATNVSPTAPTVLKWLNTNGISGGTIGLVGIGCTDDGNIYACNVDTTGNWKLYRWANSDTNTVPQLVYGPGNPFNQGSNYRVGDVMTIRGTGTNTQIIVDNQDTSSGRFVAVLTPTDQYLTNFVSVDNVVQTTFANTTIGRSLQWFSSTNLSDYTFWQKHRGNTIIQSVFDPSALHQLAVSNMSYSPFPSTTDEVWIDNAHNLVFTIRTNNVTTPYSLEMYDFTDPTSPIFIAGYSFPANPPVGNANDIGQIIVSGDYVFAIAANNGMLAFELASGPPSAPGFLAQPNSLRLIQGGTGSLTVVPDQTAAFQWFKNGSSLSGGTAATFTIANAQLTNAGSYTCLLSNQYGMGTSAVATVTVTMPSSTYSLAQVWATAPSAGAPYATTNGGSNSPYERSIAYNALSNQLIVVQCPVASTAFSVYVVDADTGNLLYTLNTNGIVHEGSSEVSGQNPVDLLSVAIGDDGAIYVCNESPNASGGSGLDPTKLFRVYCWTNSDPATTPTTVFAGDPANQTANFRWGDSLAVRGAGLNTELIADAGTGSFGAILKPTSAALTTFTNAPYAENYPGSIGRSLQFGPTNTFWLKRKGVALQFQQYNLTSQLASTLNVYSQLPTTMAGITLSTTLPVAAGVDFTGNSTTPDSVAFFEVSDWTTPLLIAHYSFPSNQVANANNIGQTIFAGNKVFALDGNNGIVAFTIQPPVGNSPKLSIMLSGSNVVLSWPTNSTGFTLMSTPSLTSPITWNSEGTGTVSGSQYVVTNSTAGGPKFYRLQQ